MMLLLSACLVNDSLYLERKAATADVDGDGVMAEDDCDDDDAGVAPGLDEVCDGVDQDCDGDIDETAVDAAIWYADGDGDGYGASGEAASACEAPPGHASAGGDCDDANAGANPAAAETAYDGVDQDCDGADLTDVDGDGWDAREAGGEDCGDGDAGVFPGAGEVWEDGFTDNDCDGEIETLQLDYASAAWTGTRSADELGRCVAAPGDLDGDGRAEVIIGTELESTPGANSGSLYIVSGAPGGSLDAAPSLRPTDSGQYFGSGLDAGPDITGDGLGDVLVTAIGTSTTAGAAWLIDGAAWFTRGSVSPAQVADGVVTAAAPGTYGPGKARFVGDVDGDGIEDVALGECCSNGRGYGSVGRVAIFGAAGFDGTLDDGDVIIDGPFEGAYFGHGVDAIGDQDGDGLPEVVVSASGGLLGAVVPGRASGEVRDVAVSLLYGTVDGGVARSAGDIDGDEREDLVALGQSGVLAFYTALESNPIRTVDQATFTFTWTEVGGVYGVVSLGDRDGDGRSETLIPLAWSNSGTQRLWILPGGEVSAGGTASEHDVRLSGVSAAPGSLFGYSAVLAGDVDADGRDDVLLGGPEYSAGAPLGGGATLITVPD